MRLPRHPLLLAALAALALLAACGKKSPPAPPVDPEPQGPKVTQEVGPAGGTVTGPDGAAVEVPAGATDGTVTIGIQKLAGVAPFPGFAAAGSAWVLTPHDAPFQKPVTVRIPVDVASLPAGSQVALAKLDGQGRWTLYLAPAYQDGKLVEEVRDFSTFVPTVIPPPPPLPGAGPFTPRLVPDHPERFQASTVVGPPPVGALLTTYAADIDRPERITGTVRLPYLPSWCSRAANVRVEVSGGAGSIHHSGGDFAADALSIPFTVDAVEKSAGSQLVHGWFDCLSPPPPPRHLTCPLSAAHLGLGLRLPDCPEPGVDPAACVEIPGNQFDCTVQDLPTVTAIHASDKLRFDYVGARASLGILEFILGWYNPVAFPPTPHDGNVTPWRLAIVVEGSPMPFGALLVGGSSAAGVPLQPLVCDFYGPGCPYLPPDHVVLELQRSRDGGATWTHLDHLTEVDVHGTDYQRFPNVGNPGSYQESWLNGRFDWARLGSVPYTWPYGPAQHVPPGLVFGFRDLAAELADDGARFRVVATRTDPASGAVDQVTSEPVSVLVAPRPYAPYITSEPHSLMVTAGGEVVFQVSASARPDPVYQWQVASPLSSVWENMAGAVEPTLRFGARLADNGRRFRVVVSNEFGQEVSEPVELLVTPADVAPTILVEPLDATTAAGAPVAFQVGARGTDTLSYAWLRDGVELSALDNPSAASPTLTLTPALADDGATFQARVTNVAGQATSRVAVLHVTGGPPLPLPPVIDLQPVGLTVAEGSAATLAVAASGSGPLAYQWSRDLTPIPGATAPVLAIAAAGLADAGFYTVTVTGPVSPPATSVPALLTVIGPPAITSQPASATVGQGNRATFAVGASGSRLHYQWMRNGVPVAGATSASHQTPPVLLGDSGATFSALVWNEAGVAFSDGAVLTVVDAPPVITSPLSPATVAENTPVTFTVSAVGGPPPGYAWTLGGAAIPGCTAATCTFTPAWSDSGKEVQVVASNGLPPDASSSALLTVTVADTAPVVTQQPADAAVIEPAAATFTVAGTGIPAPDFQWEASDDAGATWTAIPGATSPTYTTPPSQGAWTGRRYRAQVSNLVRTPPATTTPRVVWSSPARLTVMPAPPANALLATAVVAGNLTSRAIGLDGTLWAWGRDVDAATGQYSELNSQAAPWALTPVQVQGEAGTPLAGVVAVALSHGASGHSTYALHADGTVSAWGRNDVGQLGDGTMTLRAAPVKVMDGTAVLDKACSIAAANVVLVVVRSDEPDGACGIGKAKRAWVAGLVSGSAAGGLPAPGTFSNGAVIQPVPGLPAGVPVSRVTALGTMYAQGALLFFLEDGTVRAWGWNQENQLGAGASQVVVGLGPGGGPAEVSSFWSGVDEVSLGAFFSVARTPTGGLLAVGRNQEGQLGDGTQATVSTRPTLGPVSTLTSASAVSAGYRTVLALQAGEVWGWGFGWDLLGETQSPFLVSSPRRVGTGMGFTAVSTGLSHALLLGPGGAVYAWGSGSDGALGNGSATGTVAEPAVVTH